MKSFLLLFLLIVSIHFSNAQTFTAKAPFAGNPRWRAISFGIGNYGYFGTGNLKSGTNETSDMWKYDPSANSWFSIAPLPQGMQAGVGFTIDTNGYAGIGWHSSNAFSSFYQYNPASNSWSTVASFTGALTNDAVGFNIGNYGYIGMGSAPYGNCLNQFYQYNPTTNSWFQEANFSGTATRVPIGIGYGNFGFMGGGIDNNGTTYFDYYKFNADSNKWSSVANIPDTTSYGSHSFEINGVIYVCGTQMWAYNVAGNSWSQINNYPDSLAVNGTAGAFSINGNGYIIEFNSTNFYEFSPAGSNGNCTTGDITTGLVAYYPFTGSANDASGNGNNGVVNGATLTANHLGIPNSAYHFDGSGQYIAIPNSSSLAFSSNQISIAFWVKVEAFPSGSYNSILISKQSGSGNTQSGFNIEQSSQNYLGSLISSGGGNFGGSGNVPSNSSNYNTFHHVVFTYNNGNGYAYLDDSLVGSNTGQTAIIGANSDSLLFGKANWLNINAVPFTGVLDGIRIYNRALTSCDVDSLFNFNPCAGISATISAQSATTFCQGDSVILTANTDSAYLWNNTATTQSITVKQSGSYTITVTNSNNCTAVSAPTIVTVNPLPVVSVNPVSNFININAPSLTLSGNPNGGTFFGAGVNGNNFDPSSAGLGNKEITYVYTNGNKCTNSASISTVVYDTTGLICSTTDTLVINAVLTGIAPPNNINTLKVYPNPAHNNLIIDCGNYLSMNGYSVKIVNSLAQVVFQSAITQQQFDINISTWSVGTYVLYVINPSSTIISTKEIVVQ